MFYFCSIRLLADVISLSYLHDVYYTLPWLVRCNHLQSLANERVCYVNFSMLQRCHERMVKSRENFLDKYRRTGTADDNESIVKTLMMDEWKNMCSDQKESPLVPASDTEFDVNMFEGCLTKSTNQRSRASVTCILHMLQCTCI